MEPSIPKVVVWYERYCQAAVALLLSGSALGFYALWARVDLAESLEVDPSVMAVFGGLWILTLLFLAFVHFAALRSPRAPWAWKIHAIVLGVGMTTLVLWPAALPLMWYWMKPGTKQYFGVEAEL
jgi:hypothetical protein